VQRITVHVPIGGVAGCAAGDVLRTEQLANCIAIVAFDGQHSRAAMMHWNTLELAGDLTPYTRDGDADQEAAALAAVTARIAVRKQQVLAALGPINTVPYFKLGLGGLWRDLPNRWRTVLIRALYAHFGTLPAGYGATAEFTLATFGLRLLGLNGQVTYPVPGEVD
jgi:hypothetical protein